MKEKENGIKRTKKQILTCVKSMKTLSLTQWLVQTQVTTMENTSAVGVKNSVEDRWDRSEDFKTYKSVICKHRPCRDLFVDDQNYQRTFSLFL